MVEILIIAVVLGVAVWILDFFTGPLIEYSSLDRIKQEIRRRGK